MQNSFYVRVGGIQALSRLMHDSPIHHDDILEVLAAFISHHASVADRDVAPREAGENAEDAAQPSEAHRAPTADVQAALTAIAHRPRRPERRAIALAGLDLAGADLEGANLARADLAGADLAGVRLRKADMSRANLRAAALTGADLTSANLTFADLSVAELTGAQLPAADLRYVYARSANFTDANLASVDMRGTNLAIANLTRAYLSDANLVRAYFRMATLTGANLRNARLRDVRGLMGEQLQQAMTDNRFSLKGKYDLPRWSHTPGPERLAEVKAHHGPARSD